MTTIEPRRTQIGIRFRGAGAIASRPVAVAEGGPLSLIRDRQTGWLCDPEPEALAAAIAQLAASSFLRARISRAALADVRDRSWESAFDQLAAGYERALARPGRKPKPAPIAEAA